MKLLDGKQTLKETIIIQKQKLLLHSYIINAFPWIKQSNSFTRRTPIRVKIDSCGPHNLISSIVIVCSHLGPCE